MEQEKMIWEGHPSQLINLPVFLLCGLLTAALAAGAVLLSVHAEQWIIFGLGGLAVVPLLVAFWKWLETRCRGYELSTERIHLSHGIFSRHTDAVELYRVKDYALEEPFFYRMFGRGNVVLTTTDDANPRVVLQAVPQVKQLRDEIRKYVEDCRGKRGVRVTELE